MTAADEWTRRFWLRVNKDGPIPDHVPELGPCWVWTGSRTRAQYGNLKAGRENDYAHRVSWKLLHGPIAPGLQVLHHCDNPPCVRDSHLFLGTNADNIADRVAKGRPGSQYKRLVTHCPQGHSYDEANTHWYRGERGCWTCERARKRDYMRNRAQQARSR